jgi:hypothetical protein
MTDYKLRKDDCATRSEIMFKCKRIRWMIKLRLLCNMFWQEYSTTFVSEIREHESWSFPFLVFSCSTYIFNVTTKCTNTIEYLYYLLNLQTCFGAECSILRENSYHFSKPCAIVRLSHWLINFMLCTTYLQTYLYIFIIYFVQCSLTHNLVILY